MDKYCLYFHLNFILFVKSLIAHAPYFITNNNNSNSEQFRSSEKKEKVKNKTNLKYIFITSLTVCVKRKTDNSTM